MQTLSQKVEKISLDSPEDIPWIVRLLENPESRLALPGKISLFNHDCLHLILEQPQSPQGKAFVIGFCMGNDSRANWIHIQIFKFSAHYIYPKDYRLYRQDFDYFDQGFKYGKSLSLKKINRYDFRHFENFSVGQIQVRLGINRSDLELLSKRIERCRQKRQSKRIQQNWAEFLKWSSSFFAVIGGFLLALNLAVSSYGFILLAASSSQLLVSSFLKKDKSLIFYSGSIFFCVDLLGIYRWILN